MSETTWKVQQDTPSWSPEFCVSREGSDFVAYTYTQQDAERIARLLTEEDEKIAHNGHFDRAWSLWESNGCQSPNEAWQAWWDGICARRPSFILSQLEAAYRAATEAEQ